MLSKKEESLLLGQLLKGEKTQDQQHNLGERNMGEEALEIF